MIDFCYRGALPFAFLVVSRVFDFPQTDDRGTLRKRERARSDDDEKDSPNE